jgi:hypothetical protein
MKKVLAAAGIGAALAAGALVGPGTSHADFVFDICGSGVDGVVDGTPTSCPFADNVRVAYFQSGGGSFVEAYSPVTERLYAMDCGNRNFVARFSNGTSHPSVLCTGGNNAAVVIW